MELHIISIFPEMFKAITDYGVIGRAVEQKILSLTLYNPRDYCQDKYRRVDDRPFGGGPGMVMMAEPLMLAIQAAKKRSPQAKVVYLSPQGKRFDHASALMFAQQPSGQADLILLAGRYEGVDERLLQKYVDEQWSIGDYVLSGGELAVMVMVDAIARLLPNSLGNNESAEQDSFVNGLLDCPHYTRPSVLSIDDAGGEQKLAVPEVLLSGDHRAIAQWRLEQALGRTFLERPDLLQKITLTEQQQALLEKFKREQD